MKTFATLAIVICLLTNPIVGKKHYDDEEHSAFEKSYHLFWFLGHKKLSL